MNARILTAAADPGDDHRAGSPPHSCATIQASATMFSTKPPANRCRACTPRSASTRRRVPAAGSPTMSTHHSSRRWVGRTERARPSTSIIHGTSPRPSIAMNEAITKTHKIQIAGGRRCTTHTVPPTDRQSTHPGSPSSMSGTRRRWPPPRRRSATAATNTSPLHDARRQFDRNSRPASAMPPRTMIQPEVRRLALPAEDHVPSAFSGTIGRAPAPINRTRSARTAATQPTRTAPRR